MKTNIFLNSYQQAENKLTYNFLSILELTNSKVLCEYLLSTSLTEKPIQNIRTVYGGGESNPDGSFDVKKSNGDIITVYFENKTKRRGLSVEQLELHLKWLKTDDVLLVVTPRKSDIDIIRGMNNERIKFFTWTEVANQLKKEEDPIVIQFLEYGKLSGEFEELGELHKSDIELYCEYIKINYENKLNNILNDFHYEVSLAKYGFDINKRINREWGRYGTEFINGSYELDETSTTSFGQFWTIAYYYDPYDHEIPLKKEQPEICVFFDVHPDKKAVLREDKEFEEILQDLTRLGFENNVNEKISPNDWRLFFYRRPISEFTELSVMTLLRFTDEVFQKLLSVDLKNHKYFEELKPKPDAQHGIAKSGADAILLN